MPPILRTPRARPLAAVLALALVWTLLAPPAAAYIVVLKDGSRIVADKEYEIRGERAIITLPNGTETFLDAAEIDREATEEANQRGYGRALIIDRSDTKQVRAAPEPEERSKSLTELAGRETRPDRLEPHRRRERAGDGAAGRTPAGYLDLSSLPHRPFANLDLAAEVQLLLRGQGIDGVELYQGSEPDRLYAGITANSEASVFRALEVAAAALLAASDSHPGEVSALELYLTTSDRQRAGQFVLTPELARELVGGGIEASRFFVKHVQF